MYKQKTQIRQEPSYNNCGRGGSEYKPNIVFKLHSKNMKLHVPLTKIAIYHNHVIKKLIIQSCYFLVIVNREYETMKTVSHWTVLGRILSYKIYPITQRLLNYNIVDFQFSTSSVPGEGYHYFRNLLCTKSLNYISTFLCGNRQ